MTGKRALYWRKLCTKTSCSVLCLVGIYKDHAIRLNYRPEVSAIDVEFPTDLDPNKVPELNEAVITPVHLAL